MIAPTPAVGTQPGWRGTDPDGGTWVLTPHKDSLPWIEVLASNGRAHYRSQEEAEAAGLVRLIPAVGYHYDERGEDVVPDGEVDAAPAPLDPEGYVTVPGFGKWLPRGLKYLFEQVGVPEGGCAVMEAVDAVLDGRPPAPLDPGNPENLRQVADVLEAMPGETFQVAWESLNERIFRLEDAAAKKARAAEQDAADRQLAEEIAQERSHPVWWHMSEENQKARTEDILAGIRAERARQAAGL